MKRNNLLRKTGQCERGFVLMEKAKNSFDDIGTEKVRIAVLSLFYSCLQCDQSGLFKKVLVDKIFSQ